MKLTNLAAKILDILRFYYKTYSSKVTGKFCERHNILYNIFVVHTYSGSVCEYNLHNLFGFFPLSDSVADIHIH